MACEMEFGIPDVDLPTSTGGTLNPACFAGHELLVAFLPSNSQQAAGELEAYRRQAERFVKADAWLLPVSPLSVATSDPESKVLLDADGAAWRAFADLAGPSAQLDRDRGAAFFFTRGGVLHRVWPGCGQLEEIVRELQSRG